MHVACAKICRLGFVYIKVSSLWHRNVVSLNLEKKKRKTASEKTINKSHNKKKKSQRLRVLSEQEGRVFSHSVDTE